MTKRTEPDALHTGPLNTGPLNTGPLNLGPLNTGPLNPGLLEPSPLEPSLLEPSPLDPVSHNPVPDHAPTTPVLTPNFRTKPRTRWAGILWGAIAIASSGYTLSIAASNPRRDDLAKFASQLGWGGIIAVAVLAFGALLFILGLLAVLRRRR